jgi:hypothetical protein
METNDEEHPTEVTTANANQPQQHLPERTWRQFLGWLRHPNRERPKWTDVSLVLLYAAIVILALMQWWEIRESGKQTDKLVAAATGINAHQAQLVTDNKQTLLDNRNALAAALKENRDELRNTLEQDRNAQDANTMQLLSLVNEYEKVARATESVAKATVKSVNLGNRAIVNVFRYEVSDITPDKPITVKVTIANTSRTPATNLHGIVKFRFWPTSSYPPLGYTESDSTAQRGRLTSDDPFWLQATMNPIGAAAYDSYKTGATTMYIWGTVWYADINSGKFARWTDFCNERSFENATLHASAPCKQHQDTEDDHPNEPWRPLP